MKFLVGTYTHIAQAPSASRGVYLYDLDLESLSATELSSVEVKNPSFVAVQSNNAYTLSETGAQSLLHSIAIENDTLRLTASLYSPGDDPCHLVAMGDKLYMASYSAGAVIVMQLSDNGALKCPAQRFFFLERSTSPRQQASHIHNIAITPCGKWLVASNLGGDCLHLFERHNNGLLTPVQDITVAPESGPRHMAWNASGNRLYLINELSDEVMTFTFNGQALEHIQTVMAARTPGHGAGDIHIHPSGQWVYASVRLVDDGIALFSINGDGTLERKAFYPTGRHPRNFAITPCGRFLMCACRDKNAIELYSINTDDGTLTYLEGHDIDVPLPVCITLL